MLGTSPEPKPTAVALGEGLRSLIRQTYPEMDHRLAIVTMIERHLDYLNAGGDYEAAARFLACEEEAIREDAKRLRAAKRRRVLRLISGPVNPIGIIIAAMCVSDVLGISL
jgi:hypothetical protein